MGPRKRGRAPVFEHAERDIGGEVGGDPHYPAFVGAPALALFFSASLLPLLAGYATWLGVMPWAPGDRVRKAAPGATLPSYPSVGTKKAEESGSIDWPTHPLAFCPAGEMELAAAIAAVGKEWKVGASHGRQCVLRRDESGLLHANAQPRAHRCLPGPESAISARPALRLDRHAARQGPYVQAAAPDGPRPGVRRDWRDRSRPGRVAAIMGSGSRRRLKIYFDGGCRPNPGRIEVAVVVRGVSYYFDDLGYGTSSDAEWLALRLALRLGQSLGERDFDLIGDCANVIAQANGASRCRTRAGAEHRARFRESASSAPPKRVRWIPRTQNLAGIALARRRGR